MLVVQEFFLLLTISVVSVSGGWWRGGCWCALCFRAASLRRAQRFPWLQHFPASSSKPTARCSRAPQLSWWDLCKCVFKKGRKEKEGDAAEATPQLEKKEGEEVLQEPEQVLSSKSSMKTMVKEASATAVQGGLCRSRYSCYGGCHTGTDGCALKEAAGHGKLMWFCRYRSLWRTCAKLVCFWWTVKKTHTGDVLDGLYPMGGTLKCSRKRVWEGWAAVTKINLYELDTNWIPHPPAPFGRKEVEDTGVPIISGFNWQ